MAVGVDEGVAVAVAVGVAVGEDVGEEHPVVVAARLEEEFGKPAICNQTAQLWDILHLLKDWQPIKGHGRLLAAA